MFPKSICIFLAAMSCGVPATINLSVFAALNAAAAIAHITRAHRTTTSSLPAYGMKKDPHPAV